MDVLHIVCIRQLATSVFYDDNVWIGLDMAEWYIITRDKRYLTQAEDCREVLEALGWVG